MYTFSRLGRLIWAAAVLTAAFCAVPAFAGPRVQTMTLANSVQVLAIHFEKSTNESIFLFLPLGLLRDEAGHTQWAHLVEHLVIRATEGQSLEAANAETGPTGMRLDFYGNTKNWKEGLSKTVEWLGPPRFTQQSLEAEKPKVNQECDYTVKNLATHKFAMAAWNQVYRYGQTNIGVKKDILKASLKEIQAEADNDLVTSNNVLICFAGGVQTAAVMEEAKKAYGNIHFGKGAKLPGVQHGDRIASWDLEGTHIVVCWTIPGGEAKDFAAFVVAAQWLNMNCAMDPGFSAKAGYAQAGADIPVGNGTNLFYFSAALKPGTNPAQFRQMVLDKVQALQTPAAWLMAPMMAQNYASMLEQVANPASLALQPGQEPWMLEGNIALAYANNDFLYKDRPGLVRRLRELKTEDAMKVIAHYLSADQASILILRPAP